jgi:glutamine cyclotransferase
VGNKVRAERRGRPGGQASARSVQPRREAPRRTALRGAVLGLIFALAVVGVVVFATRSPRVDSVSGPAQDATPVYRFDIVNVYPHDAEAFTQGLLYRDGYLYESTGLKGRSSLRKVEVESGKVVQQQAIDKQYFAEGLTDWRDRLFQLTWETNVGFVYDMRSFGRLDSFKYEGEGWGLTHDDRRLIMSDGTARLRFLDPETLRETARVTVVDGVQPIQQLNELEFVRGEVFANVWLTDRIARINPDSGRVTGWVDLTGLMPAGATSGDAVLNGIAYDSARDRLFVTGKLWPRLFEIRLKR